MGLNIPQLCSVDRLVMGLLRWVKTSRRADGPSCPNFAIYNFMGGSDVVVHPE